MKKALDGYPKSLDATLCSFSNIPGGGTIICGVVESDNFVPVGVYNIAELEKTITSKLRKQLHPPNTCTPYRLEYNGYDILVVDIPGLPATERPARIGKDYYVRVGDGDYRMSDYEITFMLSQREQRPYDADPVEHTTVQDLDSELSEAYIAAVRRTSTRIDSTVESFDVLKRKRVIALGAAENLTLAGLYALGDYPQQFFPSLKVTGVVVDPSRKVRNLDKFEADGPIPFMLREALTWAVRNLRHPVKELESGHLVDSAEIPLVALREIIANALVHRSLNPNTYVHEVQVRILPHEVQVQNPGGLWGITDEDLQEHGTHSRVNPLLYDICTMVRVPGEGYRVIEGEGSGIPTAQEAVQQAGLKPIRFIDGATQFTAIISREPASTPDSAPQQVAHQKPFNTPEARTGGAPRAGREDAVLTVLQNSPDRALTVNQLQELMTGEYAQLKIAQVRYILNKLIEAGLVEREGGRGIRRTVYRSV